MSIIDDRAVLVNVLGSERAANAAVAASLAEMDRYYQARSEFPEAAADATFDHRIVHTSAIAELAAALATTYQAVEELLRQWQATTPLVRDAFCEGSIGLPKVRVIREHTLGARWDLMYHLESEIVRCAVTLAPRALGREIDRLLTAADPEWDRESRKWAASTEPKVRVASLARGMGRVSATVTGAESVEMSERIEDELKKICRRDPRSLDQLRAQAVVVLFRKGALTCTCGESECDAEILGDVETVRDRPSPDIEAERSGVPQEPVVASATIAPVSIEGNPGSTDDDGTDDECAGNEGASMRDEPRAESPSLSANPSTSCSCSHARGPTYLIHISADLETILGVGTRAAHMHGYGPIDAATARAMASDSTWQITFTASRKYLDLLTGGEDCLEDDGDWDAPSPSTPSPSTSLPTTSEWAAACQCTCCDRSRMATQRDVQGGTVHGGGRRGREVPGGVVPEGEVSAGGDRARLAEILDEALCRADRTASSFATGIAVPTPGQIRDEVRRVRDLANERAQKAGVVCDLVLGRTRKIRGGFIPADPAQSDERRRDAGSLIDYWRSVVKRDPSNRRAEYPDGHGGHRMPPPGALTYTPGAALAAYVRGQYPVCLHPGCSVPSARCDLDHIVEFDHKNPHAGGWTIRSNLGPFCRLHHNLKTAKAWDVERLPEDVVHLIDPLGNHYFTAPEL